MRIFQIKKIQSQYYKLKQLKIHKNITIIVIRIIVRSKNFKILIITYNKPNKYLLKLILILILNFPKDCYKSKIKAIEVH
jgi:hypothetical protein